MACYGLVRSLLDLGVEVDMVLPTREEVYFPLRKASDTDRLPIHFFHRDWKEVWETQEIDNLISRLRHVGVSETPEAYLSPSFRFESFLDLFLSRSSERRMWEMGFVENYLRGEENIFRKVQEFTERIVRVSPMLQGDLVHVHDWLTYPAGIFLKQLTGKPLIAHIHATEFDRAGGPGDERIHNIEYAGLSAADRVIAVSKYTAQIVVDRYRIDPQKIQIVHNAHSIRPDTAERKKLFKDPVVLFMGRVTLQKGPDYFLEVAARVLKKYPKVRFIMAGAGDMFRRIVHSSAGRRLKDRFLFSGFLDRKQVESILSRADIFVMPSVSEPFGIVPLEAMAHGVATIVSKQSGVSEVIKNAYPIDFWDVEKMTETLLFLLENPEERAKIAQAGREEVLAIQWKNSAELVKALYKELLCST